MQRWQRVIQDIFGNPAPAATVTVYQTGTSNLAAIYDASEQVDTPTTLIANPIITGSDGVAEFAAPDGDYDLVIAGSNVTTQYIYRLNLFDSTTATTIPVSSISLSMPAEFSVTGSPGTSLTVGKATQNKNLVWASSGATNAQEPSFRALVAADLNTVACDLTTAQSVGGGKTFTSGATFSAGLVSTTLTASGAVTLSSTVSVAGTLTMATGTDIKVNTASPAIGWKVTPGIPVMQGVSLSSFGFTKPYYGWLGTKGGTNTANTWVLVVPHEYASATDIYIGLVWTTKGTNTGNVKWNFDYSIQKGYSQGALATSATSITFSGAGSGTAYKIYNGEFPLITGTNIEPGTIIVGTVTRDYASGSDTCSDDACYFNVQLVHQKSRFARKTRTGPGFDS